MFTNEYKVKLEKLEIAFGESYSSVMSCAPYYKKYYDCYLVESNKLSKEKLELERAHAEELKRALKEEKAVRGINIQIVESIFGMDFADFAGQAAEIKRSLDNNKLREELFREKLDDRLSEKDYYNNLQSQLARMHGDYKDVCDRLIGVVEKVKTPQDVVINNNAKNKEG